MTTALTAWACKVWKAVEASVHAGRLARGSLHAQQTSEGSRTQCIAELLVVRSYSARARLTTAVKMWFVTALHMPGHMLCTWHA